MIGHLVRRARERPPIVLSKPKRKQDRDLPPAEIERRFLLAKRILRAGQREQG